MKMITGLLAAAAVLTGCMGGAVVNREGVAETRKVAVVSVVMPRVADSARESNRAALQAAVERALTRAQADLKAVRNWTVVNPSHYRGTAAVMSVTRFTREEIAAMVPPDRERAAAEKQIERELAGWKGAFIGAKGLPVVPRSAVVQAEDGTTVLDQIPPVMQKHAAWLCKALNVDAVAFVHILARISHPRPKTYLVSNNRTDGAIYAAQTMVIVDKTGKIVVDMGWPELDDGARSRDLLPLYIGSGESAVMQDNIDLGDPQNKIVQALFFLIDETAADLTANLKNAAQ